jgi:hypothetical protein
LGDNINLSYTEASNIYYIINYGRKEFDTECGRATIEIREKEKRNKT